MKSERLGILFLSLIAVFVFLSIFTYKSTWNSPLVYDSELLISEFISPSVPLSIKKILATERPVTRFSFYCDALLGKPNFRLTNSVILGVTGALVFLMLYLLLSTLNIHVRKKEVISAGLALIFILHPLQVNVVTYAVQRMSILGCMFYIAAIDVYLMMRLGLIKKHAGITLVFLFSILALFSKENTVTIPVAIVMLECFMFPGKSIFKNRAVLFICTAFVVVLLCSFNFSHISDFVAKEYTNSGLQFQEVLLTQSRIVFLYISLIFLPLPSRLNLLHVPIISSSIILPGSTMLSVIGIATLILLVFALRKKMPLGAFGTAFFMMNLVIESVLLPIHLVFEHRAILPMVGLLLLGADILSRVIKKIEYDWRSREFVVCCTSALLLCIFYSWSTGIRNDLWKTREGVWRDVIEKLPEESERIDRNNFAMAYYNLGTVLKESGNMRSAIVNYKKAIKIKPYYANAHSNMGNALEELGNFPEAIEQYREALKIKPDFFVAHANLGSVLRKIGRNAEAEEHLNMALEIKPDFVSAIINLGLVMLNYRNIPEALRYFKMAINIKPDSPEALCNVGFVLAVNGKAQEAIEYYNEALRYNPNFAKAYYNLGSAMGSIRKFPEAILNFKKALQINPSFIEADYNISVALRKLGRTKEAIKHLKHALLLKPDYFEVLINLGSTLAAMGNINDSIRYFSKAVAIRPKSAEAHWNLGRALKINGRVSEGALHIKKASELR